MLALALSGVLFAASPALAQVPGFGMSKQFKLDRLSETHWRATGQVEMQRGDMSFFADVVDFYTDTERLEASGNVVFVSRDGRIAAERAEFNTRTARASSTRRPGARRWANAAPRACSGRRSPRMWLAAIAGAISILPCAVQPTETTPTPPPTGTICDDSAFITDVTVPDGTTVKAGQPFTKTWRIRNSGTCTWSAGYRLAFVGGGALGGTSTLLGKAVSPNSQTDISVTLTAPNSNGTYKGDWRMHNASNVAFGSTVYVVVKVSDAGGPTAPVPASGCPSGQFRVSGNLNVTDGRRSSR